MFTRRKKSRKALRFESLNPRLMMTGNELDFSPAILSPVTVPIPEPASLVQTNTTVNVTGSTFGTDDFKLVLGTHEHEHVLTLDGVEHRYDADEVNDFEFNMRFQPPYSNTDILYLNRDKLKIVGSQLDDEIVINQPNANTVLLSLGTHLTMTSSEYTVRVTNGAQQTRIVGAGGNDTVKFYDTWGDDRVYMHSDFSTFALANGSTVKVSGVERVQAYSSQGGYDRVNFYDTTGNDRFVGKQNFSFMNGDGFSNYAKGFDRVDAYHRYGGVDEAILYDSVGDDQLTAWPDRTEFRVGETLLTTHEFRETRAIASDGNDTAVLNGERFTEDVFVWEPTSAFMHTTGVEALSPHFDLDRVLPTTSTNYAVGFDQVRGRGNEDAGDRAELRGSSGSDVFYGNMGTSFFTASNDAQATTTGFGIVRAHGRGGVDEAKLADGVHNDRFVSNDRYAYMKGYGPGSVSGSIPPIFGPGFSMVNYVDGFEKIDVLFHSGGFDTVKITGYGKPNDDYLVIDGKQLLLFGQERNELITGLRGYSSAVLIGNDARLVVENPASVPISLSGQTISEVAEAELEAIRDRLEDGVVELVLEIE